MNAFTKKMYRDACVDSHQQELKELKDQYGINNVKDFYYSNHRGTWILCFHEGADQEFDTKEELITWLTTED